MKLSGTKRKNKFKRWLIGGLVVMIVGLLAAAVAGWLWYQDGLKPVDPANAQVVQFKVTDGMNGSDIARQLERDKLIRNQLIFMAYLRLSGGGQEFKAGVYTLSPQQDLPQIVDHLTSGLVENMSVTLYPGAMLNTKAGDVKTNVVNRLRAAQFSDSEIQQALSANYQASTLFQGRPAGASLEGYIWGDTYVVSADATATQVLQRAISEFDTIVTRHGLAAKFAQKGLTLYQGITLASIVQRESIGCGQAPVCQDQRRIARVFYNRLQKDIPLGSDVTYHYAADRDGVARSHTLNSPYNTRIHKGLPPGPIAVPGLSALNAVADPAATQDLYFLSGDDDVTYFGKTEAEHQANVNKYCHKKCQLP